MEQGKLPFSRIRCVRSDPRALTPEMHQASHLIAYSAPAYPPEAKAEGIEGKVTLDAVIGKDGIIQTLAVREGHPLLARSAIETVCHWAYRPTTVNGVPVEVATEIEVSFP